MLTNVYFGRQCLKGGLVPEYASIGVAYTSSASKVTQKEVQETSIRDEMKYVYKKKEILKKSLYKTHLHAAREWWNRWDSICESIHGTVNQEFERNYKLLDNKLI